MIDPRPAQARPWKPRFTIGSVMICIAAIAIILTALRPLAKATRSFYPVLSQLMSQYATIETGTVLSCIVLGAYAVFRLMEMDEKA